MPSNRIATIIPVFNRPHAAIEALDSVAAQTRPPDRLIVVDDGSTDDTAARVEGWIAGHEAKLGRPAALLRQDNAGAAAARNLGVEHAGDCGLLAFLDSDDLWPTDYLERMERAFTDAPDVVAASCHKTLLDCGTGRTERESVDYMTQDATTGLFAVGPASTPNTVYRASVFDAVGGFEAGRACGEDYQLQLRLSLHGRWRVVPGEPVVCRRHAEPTADETTENTNQNGEHLSKRDDDRRLHRARFIDAFIHDEGGCDVVPASVIRRRMGGLWHSAGRSLLKQDRHDEAMECFRKALAYQPLHFRARMRVWMGR